MKKLTTAQEILDTDESPEEIQREAVNWPGVIELRDDDGDGETYIFPDGSALWANSQTSRLLVKKSVVVDPETGEGDEPTYGPFKDHKLPRICS